MSVVSFWIKTLSGRGMPDRYRGRLFVSVKSALRAADKHHRGDYEIMHYVDQKAAQEPVKECPTCRRRL